MAEREITITLKAKNLTQGQFDAAREELKKLGIEADGMTSRGQRLGQQFTATGGAAGVFNTQMAKLASAFALGAIVDRGISMLASYGAAALDSASNLVDLKNATGVSLGRLQEWTHVAEQGGAQLENLTKGAFDLSAKLASGEGLRGSVEKLGLSWTTLKNLKPEDQLDQVLRAAERLGPSQERNAILVDMFGSKGALALSKIIDGYGETAGAATKAGDAQIEALDRAGDAWAKFKRDLGTGFVQVMGTAIASMQELERGADSMSTKDKAWLLLTEGADTYAKTLRETGQQLIAADQAQRQVASTASTGAQVQRNYAKELSQVAKEAKNVDATTRAQILAANALGEKTDVLTGRFGLNEQVIKKVIEQQKAAESSTKKLGQAQAEIDPTIARLTASFTKQIDAYEKLKTTVSGPAVFEGFRLARVELVEGAPLISGTTLEWSKMRAEQERVAASMGATLAPTVKRVSAALVETSGHITTAKERWSDIASTIGDISAILDQLPGKFFEVASVAARTGQAIASNLAEGDTVGAVIAGIAGGITIIGKLFSDQNKAQVQKYNKEIGNLRTSLVDTYGPLHELERKAQTVGLSFREAWGHQGKAGLEAMTRLAQEFKTRWDALNTSLVTSRGELDTLIGKAHQLGYEFDQSGNFVGVRFDAVKAKANEFGVSVDGLGQSFRQMSIDQEARRIIEGFDLMARAGGDVGGILLGMKDEIGKLVGQSIKFGTTIPANMRPWIQNLIDTGQLIDDNGQKITDMSAIKFGEPVKTEFETIAGAIRELIASIESLVLKIGGIASAASAIPQVPAPWAGWGDPPSFDFGGDGGGIDWGGPQAKGGDYRVTRPTLFLAGEAGPERVIFSPENRPRRLPGESSAPAQPVVVNNYIVNDFTGSRTVTESEFDQIQARVYAGGIQVPARAITQRTR